MLKHNRSRSDVGCPQRDSGYSFKNWPRNGIASQRQPLLKPLKRHCRGGSTRATTTRNDGTTEAVTKQGSHRVPSVPGKSRQRGNCPERYRPPPRTFLNSTTCLRQEAVFGSRTEKHTKRAFPGELQRFFRQRKLPYINAMPRMPTLLLFGSVMLSSVLPAGMSKL